MARHGFHIRAIPHPVSQIPIIWLTIASIHAYKSYIIFFLFRRNHWIAFKLKPKLGKVIVYDSLDWDTNRYQEFIDLIQLWVNFLSSLCTSVSWDSREICLYKLTFHIFNLKQCIQVLHSYRTSSSHQQTKENDYSHKFSVPQATGRFRVPWVLHVREYEAEREIHY